MFSSIGKPGGGGGLLPVGSGCGGPPPAPPPAKAVMELNRSVIIEKNMLEAIFIVPEITYQLFLKKLISQ